MHAIHNIAIIDVKVWLFCVEKHMNNWYWGGEHEMGMCVCVCPAGDNQIILIIIFL